MRSSLDGDRRQPRPARIAADAARRKSKISGEADMAFSIWTDEPRDAADGEARACRRLWLAVVTEACLYGKLAAVRS
jgi:hypothetical protein